ncbi:Uu.00g088100.m01.CDS01 [Anthostomella pinea]|uniref:Uu.00g088100.m01.CDS01 n=1 Tax=Anthostomella pinea TaxID=933095 RepID=A0AAI8VMH4_9PEZI|nr:Uu.00g088100.m01.CDS01 [Anthostomella pinea]
MASQSIPTKRAAEGDASGAPDTKRQQATKPDDPATDESMDSNPNWLPLTYIIMLTHSKIFGPETFVFAVGPDAQELTVHKDAFRSLSPYFKALMDGNMQEALEGRAVWDDTDTVTFRRLCQFAYSGDYITPPIPDPQPFAEEEGRPSCECRSWTHYCDDPTHAVNMCEFLDTATRKISDLILEKEFNDGKIPWPGVQVTSAFEDLRGTFEKKIYTTTFPPRGEGKESDCETYTPNLQVNATMYMSFTLWYMLFRRIRDVIPVVKYIMESTVPKDAMRKLLAHFVACIAHKKVKKIDEMVDEVPEFAVEVFHVTKNLMS